MENKDIIFLHHYKLSKAEFDSIEERCRAIISVSCYAASEVNLLSKFYIFSAPDLVDEPELDAINLMQRMVILRTWSSRLFEFYGFISELEPSGENASVIGEIKEQATVNYNKLKIAGGFELARAIRHEATNHYSYSAAVKNLSHVSKDANLSLLLHEMEGNSLYPLGEEVMFAGRLNRFAANRKSIEEKRAAMKEWFDFNLEANDWLRETNKQILTRLLVEKFPDKSAYRRIHYLSKGAVSRFEEMCVPLFARSKT